MYPMYSLYLSSERFVSNAVCYVYSTLWVELSSVVLVHIFCSI